MLRAHAARIPIGKLQPMARQLRSAQTSPMPTFARRMGNVKRSFIREILKVTEDPSIISFRRRSSESCVLPLHRDRGCRLAGPPRRGPGSAPVRDDGRLPAAAAVDRGSLRPAGPAGEAGRGARAERITAGARSRGQGLPGSGRRRAGRAADVPGRAAGIWSVRAVLCIGGPRGMPDPTPPRWRGHSRVRRSGSATPYRPSRTPRVSAGR